MHFIYSYEIYMGKKSRKEKKDKPIEYYTTTEKYDEITRFKREMDVKFINNKKYPISVNILYDAGV